MNRSDPWVLFCAHDTPENLAAAKDFCAANRLGQDMVRVGEFVMVKTRDGVGYDDFMKQMKGGGDGDEGEQRIQGMPDGGGAAGCDAVAK